MDATSLVVLVGTLTNLAVLVAAFLFRKRLLRALCRLLLTGSIEFARATFVEEGIQVGEDGEKRAYVRLRPSGEALVAAVVPVLVREAAKSIKLKLPAQAGGLPPDLDLSNLSAALPAILSSGMVPKKYAGLIALAAPFLQGFLGGGKPGAKKEAPNPYLKEGMP